MWSRALAAAALAVALAGCSDPQREASEPLAEIGRLAEKSKRAAPLQALAHLRSAEERLGVLVQDHGSTDAGARLAAGDAIGEVSRGNIRQLLTIAERTACLEYPTADCIEDIFIEHLDRQQDSWSRTHAAFFAAKVSWGEGNIDGVRRLLPFMDKDHREITEVKLNIFSQELLTDSAIEVALSPLTMGSLDIVIHTVMSALYAQGDVEKACRLYAYINKRFPGTVGEPLGWLGLAILVACKAPELEASITATLSDHPDSVFGAVQRMLRDGQKDRALNLIPVIIGSIQDQPDYGKAIEAALIGKNPKAALDHLRNHRDTKKLPGMIIDTAELADAFDEHDVAKSLFLQVGQQELVELAREHNSHIIKMALKFLPADAARELISVITKEILEELKKKEGAANSYLTYRKLWQVAEAIRSAPPPAK